MKKGVDKVADAVKITLGPEGRNVAIKKRGRFHTITKDGVTVAKAITLADEYEDTGAKMVQEAAHQTNEEGGDGTTVTTILAQAMIGAGFSAVDSGASPVFLKRGIAKAVIAVCGFLDRMARPVKGYDMIKQVASISANDQEMGMHIANLFNKIGPEGVISVEESKTLGYEEEMVEGMRWSRGFVSPYMMNDPGHGRCELEDVHILITDKRIDNDQEVIPWMEALASKGFKRLLIVAEDVVGAALQTIIVNGPFGHQKFHGIAVPFPTHGEHKVPALEDMAAVTGGTVIAESKGMKIDEVDLSRLGRARRVISTKNSTVIIDGKGSKRKIKLRIKEVKAELKKADENYDLTMLKERLARLTGGIAILRFGAINESESKEMKYRIEDSVNATRHALEGGIVPGGETALLLASRELDQLKVSGDEAIGVGIVRQALAQPIKVIADNAGAAGNEVAKQVLEKNPGRFTAGHNVTGYDAAEGEYKYMIRAGIIDPVKVVKAAIQNAAGSTSIILGTGAVIVDIEVEVKKEDKNGN